MAIMFIIPIFYFVFIILIISKFSQKGAISGTSQTSLLLFRALKSQGFTNIQRILTSSTINFVTGDANGENFIFAYKNNNFYFNIVELTTLYEKAQKLHIHNIVIINTSNSVFPDAIQQKIKEYNIDVWNYNKLNSLALVHTTNLNHTTTNTKNYSVLQTSNTSDDKCKIDTNSFDPIQQNPTKKGSLFGNLFKKPERL